MREGMMGIYDELGVKTVINAAGPLTRLSGSRLDPEVRAAMAEASQWHVRIEDLQARAGEIIAEITGAEAGYVVAGAAAGLTLAAAACIAGLDPAKMDRLPDTAGLPNEIVMQKAHRNNYDHALRLAGAKIVEAGYLGYPGAGGTYAWQIEAAISEWTVAIAHPIMPAPGTVPLEEVIALAHRRGLPVIVDAAAELPPVENLRRFIAAGADLVTFSGGKAIGGPQASGILCGRRDLIESVALQHQDMDVHPATWTLRRAFLETGRLPGPPHHGIGRSMKVGKEEIVGLLVALRRFVARDHAAEARRWEEWLTAMAAALDPLPAVRAELTPAGRGRRPYPLLTVWLDEAQLPLSAVEVINALAEGEPPICVGQGAIDGGGIIINPTQLREEEVGIVLEQLLAVLGG
jgi:L-seryl-tRNA(Ser) seleniumtransferase